MEGGGGSRNPRHARALARADADADDGYTWSDDDALAVTKKSSTTHRDDDFNTRHSDVGSKGGSGGYALKSAKWDRLYEGAHIGPQPYMAGHQVPSPLSTPLPSQSLSSCFVDASRFFRGCDKHFAHAKLVGSLLGVVWRCACVWRVMCGVCARESTTHPADVPE